MLLKSEYFYYWQDKLQRIHCFCGPVFFIVSLKRSFQAEQPDSLLRWPGYDRGALSSQPPKSSIYTQPGTNSHYVQEVCASFFHFQVLVLHRIDAEHATFPAKAFTRFTESLPAIHTLDKTVYGIRHCKYKSLLHNEQLKLDFTCTKEIQKFRSMGLVLFQPK